MEKAIRRSGIAITFIARRMQHSAKWLYNQFSRPNVSVDHLLDLGEIINYDFGDEILCLKKYRAKFLSNMVSDGEMVYNASGEMFVPVSKYIELLENHNRLLEQTRLLTRKSKKVTKKK